MGKTECIIFASKRKLRKINIFSVECYGHTIKVQRSVKYLGLTLDDQLTAEATVNYIVLKVNGRLKFLYRQCNFLEELRKSICLALIQCHIDHACSSWYSVVVDFLFIVTPIVGVCNCSMFCCTLLYVHSSIAIILMGKRELIALLNLSSWCLVMVERLFLAVPRGCLQFVIVVFPDHTHLLFLNKQFQKKLQICQNKTVQFI